MPGGDSRLALGYGLFRTAVNWGLRSPNSDTNNAYYINTGGSVNNNNVYNNNFAARPALMEYRVQVANRRKQRTIIKGGHILSSACAHAGDKHSDGDADRLVTGGNTRPPLRGGDTADYQHRQACATVRPTREDRRP